MRNCITNLNSSNGVHEIMGLEIQSGYYTIHSSNPDKGRTCGV